MDNIRVDRKACELWIDDNLVWLTPSEWNVFISIYDRGREWTPSYLVADKARTTTNAVKILIAQIRRKLGADIIEYRDSYGFRTKQEDHRLVM